MNKLRFVITWFIVVVSLAIIALSGSVLYFILIAPQSDRPQPPQRPEIALPVSPPETEKLPMVQLKAYFAPRDDPNSLTAEYREVACRPDTLSRVRTILAQLQEGPRRSSLLSALPAGTRIRTAFVDRQRGTAFVDVSQAFVEGMPAGISQAGRAIYALVNTVAAVDTQLIDAVQILVEGHAIEDPVGGHNLSRPLTPEWTWIR